MILNLNSEQQVAAEAIDGDYVVIAGPGSGKTFVLVQRHLNMLMKGIQSKDILNLTFTNAAACEMVQRVGLLNADKVFRTFHSFVMDLLKREAQYLPFAVCDTIIPVYGQDFQLLKDLLKTYPAISSFRSLKDKLSEWKRSNVEPEEAQRLVYHNGTEFFMACAYADYERRCREEGWLDFDSLMKETVKLLETNDEVRKRNQFKYIAVDECQDTDIVQFQLLKLIYGGNIFVVGDENQCHPPGTLISRAFYGLGGTIPITQQVPIEKLYNGYRVVSWNKHQQMLYKKGRKVRVGKRTYHGPLLCIQTKNNSVEVTPDHNLWVRFIKKPTVGWFKIKAANILPKLMEVPSIERNKACFIKEITKREYSGLVYSLDVEEDHSYVANGIPVANCIFEWRSARPDSLSNFAKAFPGAKTLFLGQNYRSTRVLSSFFKKILPVDNGLASHMISERPEGVPPTITKFEDEMQEASVVLTRITDPDNSAVIARTNRQLLHFQRVCMAKGIKSKILGKKNLWQQTEVAHLLKLATEKEYGTQSAHEVLTVLIHEYNLPYLYRNSGQPNEKDPIENLNDIVKLSAKRGTVKEFLDWLRKLTYASRSKKTPEPVLTLTTVHQAKGREWKHVFVIGAKQGMMPHKDGELLEEHRIFFVACSRAADTLEISFYGSPSQFLNDFKDQTQVYKG